MKDGVCPKCASEKVIEQPRGLFAGLFGKPKIYKCKTCGYNLEDDYDASMEHSDYY